MINVTVKDAGSKNAFPVRFHPNSARTDIGCRIFQIGPVCFCYRLCATRHRVLTRQLIFLPIVLFTLLELIRTIRFKSADYIFVLSTVRAEYELL